MAHVTRTTTWVDQQVLTAPALNNEFDNLLNALAIVDADIASGANINFTKILHTGVTLTDTQTLSAKTLTKPIINGSVQALTTDADGSTITFDLTASNIHSVTLTANRTLALSNTAVGQPFVLRLIQDGSGSHTVTWFSTIKWPFGVVPTLTTTAGKTDVFGFLVTSAGNYDGFIIGQGL